MPSGWDWGYVVAAVLVAGVHQFVVHKRWRALIEAIREKNRRRNGD